MDFYNKIGLYYKDLFPIKEAQKKFLSEVFEGVASVLDIGAGTGGYALHLSKTIPKVFAAEIGSMYERLRETCQTSKVQCLEMGMEDVSKFNEKAVDGAYCIGNTLPHLKDEDAVSNFLRDLRQVVPTGSLVIQIVNYDRIFEKKIDKLPEIMTKEGIQLIRRYVHLESDVLFQAELKDPDGIWVSESKLLGIKKDILERLLKESGWSSLEFFGNFDKSPWDLNSPATIVVAH